ncbi:MAG: glutaredoxin family protein [Dehalococcoidia bacterium]
MAVKEHLQHVNGTKKGDITLYALSTCGWCLKTKGLLNNLKVDYSYLDVDTLQGTDREEALGEIRKWNPKCSFPTMVINNKTCIVGFKEDEVREILGHAGK